MNLAVLKCSKPFGHGLQQATSKTTVAGARLTVTGRLKNFFDNGTNHGTYELSGTVAAGTIAADGSVKITGGTGAYRNMTGTAKLNLYDHRRWKNLRLQGQRKSDGLSS